MAMNSVFFNIKAKNVLANASKRVDYIDVMLEMTDYSGAVYFTDIIFQGGGVATSWVGHVSEIKWSFDNA
ncbi:hypothetical protein [Alkaliphilus peptidifermentans]|uniref:Uncharacterized protein n=1 Tax=Alkaliphilus peptidifermentans DSM 18978 TaxID=1120976 RepID=A0A1G5JJQ6_9FIRM|nr:hypothetical protein [Alkaliphilus peptidifermentans]SCY88612.1 hypothetical protein SAMN03080606_02881 [Alkaliphilus peptidifermentans DSM 18978]